MLASSVAPVQVGQRLLRQRLEHRAGRLEHVLLALRERVRARQPEGRIPPPLLAAIDGFEHELRLVRSQLRKLDQPRVDDRDRRAVRAPKGVVRAGSDGGLQPGRAALRDGAR
jgi:hypothetical protein